MSANADLKAPTVVVKIPYQDDYIITWFGDLTDPEWYKYYDKDHIIEHTLYDAAYSFEGYEPEKRLRRIRKTEKALSQANEKIKKLKKDIEVLTRYCHTGKEYDEAQEKYGRS